MLSNFELDGRPLLQTFLIGQQQFRDTLAHDSMEQLRQRVIACYHIDPLASAEVPEYIEHRLHQAGWTRRSLFNKPAYQAIYRCTAGVPRRINVLCDRLLLFGYLEQSKTVGAEIVEQVATELGYKPMSDDVDTAPGEYVTRVDATNAA